MTSPGKRTTDAPLPPELLDRLRFALDEQVWDSARSAAEDIGVGQSAIKNALAGLPVRRATRRLIELGLEQIEAKR